MPVHEPSPTMAAEAVNSFKRISILRLIKEAQQKHGLRQGNYLRYRGYCARRTRRIRRALKFTHQHKCLPNRSAKFQLRPITPEVMTTDSRFVELAVFDVERNWAHSLQLKVEQADETRSRKHFHSRQKMRRASKAARTLETLTKQCEMIDTVTKLEAQAYAAFIRASLFIELKKWRKALELLKTVKKIYEKMSSSVKDEELTELYISKCKEVQNTIRLCEYNCGDVQAATADVASISLMETPLDLDLDFNKLEIELDKEADVQLVGRADDEENTKRIIDQLNKDWRLVDLAKLKSLKPSVTLQRGLPPLQAMPCKPLFFDVALNYLKAPLSKEKLEGKKKQQQPPVALTTKVQQSNPAPPVSPKKGQPSTKKAKK